MAKMKLVIQDEIGRGGFCMVHRLVVQDADRGEQIGNPMAIKRLRDDLVLPKHTLQEIRDRFEREARLLDDTLDHENIVPVEFRNLSGDEPYFVMPLADGSVMDELATRAGDEEWVCHVFRQILEGMAYAHGKDVIHRDLKPQNALIFGDTIRLTDLGLGKTLVGGTVGLTQTEKWYGTQAYMALEQFSEMKDTGPASDVFSLGKLLMALLIGKHPDPGLPDVSELPERFRYFVTRCCEKKPENRFPDARAALEAFDNAFSEPVFRELEDDFERLIESWFVAPVGEDSEILKKIDQLLRENPDEESLYTKQVPRLPGDLLDEYLTELPDSFVEMLKVYDRYVSGGLVFEYCDEVADFYANVFRSTDRLDIRKVIVERLIELGYSHNRWHVRIVLLELLSELDQRTDASTISLAADAIQENPTAAQFAADIASKYELSAAIKKAFKKISS
jgi:eukaryotic-like serine/threonine-protein kinase